MEIDLKNLEYAKIQVKLLNYNTILISAPINRLFLPISDYADCSNNRPDYAYGRLIGTALGGDNHPPSLVARGLIHRMMH